MSNLSVKHGRSLSPVKLRDRGTPALAKRRLYYKGEELARNALLQGRRDDQKLRAGVHYQNQMLLPAGLIVEVITRHVVRHDLVLGREGVLLEIP